MPDDNRGGMKRRGCVLNNDIEATSRRVRSASLSRATICATFVNLPPRTMGAVSSRSDNRRSWPRRTLFAGALSIALLASTLLGPLAVTVQVQTKAPTTDVAPGDARWGLTGTVLELMRGVFFPTANMIFNVQTHNPAEKKVVPQDGKESLNWVQWGSSMYSGWEDVDYAAATLAEVTPLLLAPGRLCQNGKPVPVDRADWMKFTSDMLVAARKSYEASRSRNQDAVSESTNDLSDACQACHRVYRDRRSPGTSPGADPGGGDPASLPLRCTAS